jgi:hypothetical protein
VIGRFSSNALLVAVSARASNFSRKHFEEIKNLNVFVGKETHKVGVYTHI